MIKDSSAINTNLTNALDLLSAPQIAALVFGTYALFSDLHDRAQPKPVDREISKRLRIINADLPGLEGELKRLAKRDPAKVLAVITFLRGTTHKLGAGDLAERLKVVLGSADI